MAIMHPANINNYNCTKSEEVFFNALKEQLPDDYHCYYSVRWNDVNRDDKTVVSECDFLIFDTRNGFITIELKGGRSIEVDGDEWKIHETGPSGYEETRILKKSPARQAEDSMYFFKKDFEDTYSVSFGGVYGFAVCFPFYQVNENVEIAANKEIVIDIRHMDNLKKRINEIFLYWKNAGHSARPGKSISSTQCESFLKMLNKKIALAAAAGALIPYMNKELEKINIVQDSIVDFLTYYTRAQIIGGAGTGKTFIAMKKLLRENYGKRKLLYHCKNKELALFVRDKMEKLTEGNIERITFVDWDSFLIDMFGIVPSNSLDAISGQSDHPLYDFIAVDEAQDFTEDEALAVSLLLRDENQSGLYVFMDRDQNLFVKDKDSLFDLKTPPYVLRYNVRNTGEIYNYAVTDTGLGRETVANMVQGVKPDTEHKYANETMLITSVGNIVNKLVQNDNVKTSSIVILSDVPYEQSAFRDWDKVGAYRLNHSLNESKDNEISFRTVADFKGLEADVIIYCLSKQHDLIDPKERKREDYVAYTRARYYLYIVGLK